MQSRHLNCTLMSYIHFFTCALFIACFCPQLDPHHPPGKHCGVFFFFFLWVGCQWCLQHISPEHRISVASAVGADDSSSPCGKKLYVKTWTFQWIKVSSFFSPPGIEMDYTCICKLLLTVCASEVATWFAAFFFFLLSLHPSKSLPPFLPPSPLEQMYCYSSTLPPASPTCTLALCLSQSYISV